MIKQLKKIITKLSDFLWSLFLNGLLTILPIILTLALFNLSLRLLASWLRPIRQWIPTISHKVPTLQPILDFLFAKIPYFELVVAFIIILLIGIIVRIFILRTLWHAIEKLLLKIPIIRPVYSGMKQLIAALDPQNELLFQKVVFVQFPRLGMYSVGFLASEIAPELAPIAGEIFVSVYVPTTPNPTTGFYLMVPIKEVIITNLTRQEATAIIISGGIIQPERFAKK